MEPSIITKGRHTYVHDLNKGPSGSIDVHHITIARSGSRRFVFCACALIFAFVCFLILIFFQRRTSFSQLLMLDTPAAIILWSVIFAGFLLRQLLRKQVEKGSVIILPAFGVQLETVYRSGITVRRFVPIGKILTPVLNECVTPVTCYWSLSLILRGEDELLLVFKELYPSVTILVPIWKALCAAIDEEKCTNVYSDCDTSECTPK